MSQPIAAATRSILADRCYRFAYCWTIERTDGTVYRFTNHNLPLTLGGESFTPAGGFNPSATRRQAGLEEMNADYEGAISSAALTTDDLRAGRYREAKVTQQLVDWRIPWLGALETIVYWVTKTKFDGETWRAEVGGIRRWLNRRVGKVYGRLCWHQLGDTGCGVTLATYTHAGTVTAVGDDARLDFESGLTQADGYFDHGKVTWSTGDNAGIVSEVKTFLNTDGAFELQLQTPFNIAVGDTFSAVAGCDLMAETCGTKFSNLDNFGGFPFIPGADALLVTP